MKRMSPARRLVSVPTRSPGFSSAGPDVVRMLTRSSRAISSASVVLPSPGGPEEERVVERLAPRERGIDGDAQVVLHLLLADELVEPLRAQRQLDDGFVGQHFGRGDLGARHTPNISRSRRKSMLECVPGAVDAGRRCYSLLSISLMRAFISSISLLLCLDDPVGELSARVGR